MLKFNNKVPTDIKIGNKTVEKILMRNEVVWSRPDYFYIENVDSNSGNVSFKYTGTPSSSTIQQIEYSKNKTNWTPVTLVADTTTNVPVGVGEKVYFRNGNGKCSQSSSVYLTFGSDINTNTGGELYTLLDYTDKNVSLQNYAFYGLFYQMNKLIDASDLVLRWTTLKPNCYQSAFQGCTALTSAPQLPATTLANYCYQALFRGCSSLTTAPSVIPATTAPYMCCQRMFSDCVSLKSAPQLPASTLESGSYQYMFYNCKELTQAPTELPATTLALNSYYSMFELCSKLTTPPVIKATTFAENSCTAMFRSCALLNNITVYANDISATNCTQQWLRNVAATGTFYNLGSATYTIDSENGIPVGWTERKPSLKNEYFFVENLDDGTNSIDGTNILTLETTVNSGISTKTIEYSKDKISWTTLNLSSTTPTTITMNVGDKIYFRNTSGTWNTIGNHTNLHCSEDFSVGGNIKSLIDYRVDNLQTLPIDSFRDFLSSNSHLIYSHNLFLTSITSQSCYESLFSGCKNLITAPELPATTLSKSCYYGLFLGCSSLISIPNLPATTLAENSYESMFSNCKSLTSVNIPAKTLAKCSCQLMFQGCTGLKNATLQATTIVNESCINMFMNCSSLNSITTYLSDVSPYNCLKDWLKGVAATGTLHNLGNASYTKNSTSGIPRGWTEVKS